MRNCLRATAKLLTRLQLPTAAVADCKAWSWIGILPAATRGQGPPAVTASLSSPAHSVPKKLARNRSNALD